MLRDRLGDGAEGGAWRAQDVQAGREVVAKRVPPSARAAVQHAFETLRRAASAHLPAPRSLSQAADGTVWLITEWVPGAPLSPGPVPVREALADVAAVARALASLHDMGTHHGDVSPSNVVVDGERRTLVDLAQLGRRGTGTPGFLAPEVLAGGGGPAADRFSLGALLVWRLTGEAPWPRPEALLGVESRADVRARLRSLGVAELSPAVMTLLCRTLLPQASARPGSTRELARRLGDLASADAAVVAGRLRWWVPQRWPYEGAALEEAVSSLAGGETRLLVVAGPKGSGRDRVVEELVLRLNARGHAAVRRDADAWARDEGASSGTWLEAWAGRDRRDPVVGLLGGGVALSAVPRVEAASRLARGRLIITAQDAEGDALEHIDGVRVLRPRPLSEPETIRLVSAAVEGTQTEIEALARALRVVTGAWPPALVRVCEACARRDADVHDVAAVAASAADEHVGMEPGLALMILRAHWYGPADGLPPTLAPQGRPHALACAQARLTLGDRVRSEARARRGESLAWAVDARDDAALEIRLRGSDPRDPEVVRALDMIESADAPASLLAVAASLRLAQGDAKAAEALAARAPGDPACRLARARALQRLGELDRACALLPDAANDSARLRWEKRGLRWRVYVDRGEAVSAAAEAARLGVDDVPLQLGVASALLWAAYASALSGDLERAERRLERALEWAHGQGDVEASAVAARVLQLQGNLAHGRRDLEGAAQKFAAAAAAFVRAGEPVGGLTLRGTSCALAILTLSLDDGIEHGRAALRGLLAQGQTSALVEAALNLVQLLLRVGASDEIEAIVGAVEAAVGSGDGALVQARCGRLRADARLAGAGARPHAGVLSQIAAGYAKAAASLDAASCPAEARDAWLRAAWFTCLSGRANVCVRVLERVIDALPEDDPFALARAAATTVLVATRVGDAGLLEVGLALMRRGGTSATLRAAHRLDLAIAFDRALLAALRFEHGSAAQRRALAHRLLSTVELVMQKTRPTDRPAVRTSLLAEGGDSRALRELLEDLEPGEAAAAHAQPAAPSVDDQYARLLRMYRRFAREDRLEPLLEQVVDAVMELTDAERGAVVVRRAAGVDLSVTRELSEGSEGASYSRSVIDRVLESGEPVLSVDAAADERFDDSRSISHLNLRSVLAVPLRFRGELLGAAYVDHRLRRGNFGEGDLASIEAFADLAALAVAHAAALDDLGRKTEALTASSAQLSSLLEQREAEVLALREDARRQAPARDGYRGIIGSAPAMQNVFRLIDRIADADVPVVIHGESGTGKELVARALHEAGGRAGGPFVAENCGAIPETLLESVLFGHAKGAFTGAQKAKPGLFEAADTGTIFLDEVSEMSMPMQTKLLRVLQEGEVRRVGETAPRAVNVRVVAASNRDLEAMVEQGSFRRDLFYRINVVRVDLPPLRERPQDIPHLIEHFFSRHGAPALRLAPSVSRALQAYAWPGNVRQLENEVQRWIALCEGAVALQDLSAAISGAAPAEALDPDDLRIKPRVERLERDLIARALEKTGNNQTQAAQLLGLSRYGLQKKLKRLELDVHRS
ncbi:MAG: sigma 54-interacting transcriptional regulator [Nannocystaceae bacterium]